MILKWIWVKFQLKTMNDVIDDFMEIAMNKKILKLRRKIAAVNGREGFAFDVQKIDDSGFDSYKPVQGLEKVRVLLPFFDFPIERFFDFTLLVETNCGNFWFDKHVVSVTREPEKIMVTFNTFDALRKVTVHSFKIISPGGVCIFTKNTQIKMGPGDTINLNYPIKAD